MLLQLDVVCSVGVMLYHTVLSRPSSGVTYADVVRAGNWIYLLRIQPQFTTSLLQFSLHTHNLHPSGAGLSPNLPDSKTSPPNLGLN
jgi:hypothetical protein